MISQNFRLPKIAPNVYRREKLQTWLEFHAEVPLRYVAAPAGSGKTTASVLYARSRPYPVAYVSLRPDDAPADLYSRIARTSGMAPGASGDYAEFLAQLASLERLEVIVDDVDNASPAVLHALQQLYRDAVDSITFIYLARSSEAIAFDGGVAQGLIATCDPGMFAFHSDEIALFAQALGLNEDPMSVARLQRTTLGWATAVAGVCLHAAANGTRLRDAAATWQRLNRRSLDELVADARRCAPLGIAAEFARVSSGQAPCDQLTLTAFARYGLFVYERDGRLILHPMIAPGRQTDVALDGRGHAWAIVEMFGRFSFAINGTELIWQRRRDRQIIGFLAMQPEGRATRAQLIATFWPDADPQLAAQSVRTACSTIRRAFAACVGPANVGRYFTAEQLVELNLDAVVSNVGRFQAHVAHADRAFDAGDTRSAYAHYCAAEKLYTAPLLAGEPPALWSESHAARLAEMQTRVCERLEALGLRVTSADAPHVRSIIAAHELSA